MLSSTKKKYMFIIYELGNRGNTVRSIDIASALGVKKASVSLMMPNLIEEQLVERMADGSIVFTQKGALFAGELYVKYLTLYDFFMKQLGSNEENARKDAICCLCGLTDENSELMAEYILKKAICN